MSQKDGQRKVGLSPWCWVPSFPSWGCGWPTLAKGEEATVTAAISRAGWWPGNTQGLQLCLCLTVNISQVAEFSGSSLATTSTAGSTLLTELSWIPHDLRLYGLKHWFPFQASVPEYSQISTHFPAYVKEGNPSFHCSLQKPVFIFFTSTVTSMDFVSQL